MAKKKKKPLEPTGITLIDDLTNLKSCTLSDYVAAASEYVKQSRTLSAGRKKAGQIRLSNALARVLVDELQRQLPELKHAIAGERKVSGALRSSKADVSEIHPIDGLRVAIELKPINLAVGRAIWNRFGDIRTFAVNIHLKFPFCVVGGVLAIPTYEEVGTKEAEDALDQEELVAEGDITDPSPDSKSEPASVAPEAVPVRRPTIHLIERAIARLIRAGGRKTEGDAAHLLEGIAVIVYDPGVGTLHTDIPPKGSGLRWDEFIQSLATTYQARFED